MNILVDELEEIMKEKFGNVKINTDFRISILFELLMQDNTIPGKEKVVQALQLYYPNFYKITYFDEAIENMRWCD